MASRSWPGVDPTSAQDSSQYSRGAAPVVATSAKSDIDWGDVGIGAGFAFALMLLAAGAAVGTRHRHGSATA